MHLAEVSCELAAVVQYVSNIKLKELACHVLQANGLGTQASGGHPVPYGWRALALQENHGHSSCKNYPNLRKVLAV